MFNKIKEFFKKIKQKILSDPYDSTLNPFLLSHYLKLNSKELTEAKRNLTNILKINKETLSILKKEMENQNFCEVHKDIVNEYIKDTEYQNDTLKETIRVIKLRKADLESKTLKGKK